MFLLQQQQKMPQREATSSYFACVYEINNSRLEWSFYFCVERNGSTWIRWDYGVGLSSRRHQTRLPQSCIVQMVTNNQKNRYTFCDVTALFGVILDTNNQISCDLDILCRRTNDFSPAVEFMAPHQKAHDINTAAALFIENSGVALWWMFCMQFISHMWRVCTGFIL